MSTQQAITTQSFVNSIGVNTHLDFQNYGYQNLSVTEAAINYLGVTNLRDSAQSSVDVGANGLWQQVANATGAKFVDFLPEGSVADMQNALPIGEQLAAQGILNYLEGGNEEDDSYPAGLGNSVQAAASFQQQVYAAGQQLGLPVINISFGAGWTAANNWHGDYDKVGDLSAYCNYANAHTYPSGAPLSAIQQLNADALLAASSRPVINTEFGYDTNTISQSLAAQYTIDGLLDAWLALPADVREAFDLVIAGPGGWKSEATLARLESKPRGVRYLGYVGEDELAALTAGAAAHAYPSLYEGFGFPLAQAMACGVPSVTSNVSSMPEVAAGSALLVDPRSAGELREALLKLLTSESLRKELGSIGRAYAEEHYRWDAVARESWAFFERVAG